MPLTIRVGLVAIGCGLSSLPMAATTVPAPLASFGDAMLGLASVQLWPNAAPRALGTSVDDIPSLIVFRPCDGTGNGTAVVIAPGGAYHGLAGDLEGREVADWFAARGVTAFVLRHRFGPRYLMPIPLMECGGGDAPGAVTCR